MSLSRPKNVLVQLSELEATLPRTARRIAAFIVQNAADISYMSITELAERTEASEGSVVGLCRRVGATGFAELKILIAQDQVEPLRLIQEDIAETDDEYAVADHVFAAHASALEDTRKLLAGANLTKAVDVLVSASRIEIYGIGSSAPIALDFAYRLLQIGLDARAVVDSHVQAVSASKAGKGVATVTISHSGSTIETVMATRLARAAGATTLGITRMGKSPLSSVCDVVLNTTANETRFRPEAMSSRVAQLAIVDTLVSCCAIRDGAKAVENLQSSARVLSEKRF